MKADETVDFRVYGKLAHEILGETLPIQVCKSAAGFYLGTWVEGEPCSRESVEYFRLRSDADTALASGDWTQKPTP